MFNPGKYGLVILDLLVDEVVGVTAFLAFAFRIFGYKQLPQALCNAEGLHGRLGGITNTEIAVTTGTHIHVSAKHADSALEFLVGQLVSILAEDVLVFGNL